jgi:hypothetical protein
MTDNFDLKKYLVENKVTTNSRMISEADTEATPEAISTYVQLMKRKFGSNLGNVIKDELYDEANMSYDLPQVWSDEEFAKFAKQDLELLADMDGVDVINADFAKQVVGQALEAIHDIEKYYVQENKTTTNTQMLNEESGMNFEEETQQFPELVNKYGVQAVADALEATHINAEDASRESGEDAHVLYLNRVDYLKEDPSGLIDLIEDNL